MLPIILAASSLLLTPTVVLANAIPEPQWYAQTPYCADGGQLHCCAITFNGGNAAVVAASDLACYDLTPATINCIIASDAPDGVCAGNFACCHVNDLVPLIAMYCSDPPGGCVGEEGNGECTDVLFNGSGFRFGQCDNDDVRNIRGLLGLSVGGLDVKRAERREELDEKRRWLIERAESWSAV